MFSENMSQLFCWIAHFLWDAKRELVLNFSFFLTWGTKEVASKKIFIIKTVTCTMNSSFQLTGLKFGNYRPQLSQADVSWHIWVDIKSIWYQSMWLSGLFLKELLSSADIVLSCNGFFLSLGFTYCNFWDFKPYWKLRVSSPDRCKGKFDNGSWGHVMVGNLKHCKRTLYCMRKHSDLSVLSLLFHLESRH